MSLDRCPECGKTTGTLMEQHPDAPGLIDLLTSDDWLGRLALTVALCLLVALAVTCGRAVLG